MQEHKYINTGKSVRLRDLIVSGDIDDKTIIHIYDEQWQIVRTGRWYEDRILAYGEHFGKASYQGSSAWISFRLGK